MHTIKSLALLLALPLLLAACSGNQDDTAASKTAAANEDSAASTPDTSTPDSATAANEDSAAATQEPPAAGNAGVIQQGSDALSAKIAPALAFAAARPEQPAISVLGENIVVAIPDRQDTLKALIGEIALTASNYAPDQTFTVSVVDGSQSYESVPDSGEIVCSASASNNRVQNNTC